MAVSGQNQNVEDMLAARRRRGRGVRDLTGADALPADAPGGVWLSPGQWLRRMALRLGIVAAIGLAILLAPPLLTCRDQVAFGFFAGDTFGQCMSRALDARMTGLDQQLRMLILGSGR